MHLSQDKLASEYISRSLSRNKLIVDSGFLFNSSTLILPRFLFYFLRITLSRSKVVKTLYFLQSTTLKIFQVVKNGWSYPVADSTNVYKAGYCLQSNLFDRL